MAVLPVDMYIVHDCCSRLKITDTKHGAVYVILRKAIEQDEFTHLEIDKQKRQGLLTAVNAAFEQVPNTTIVLEKTLAQPHKHQRLFVFRECL